VLVVETGNGGGGVGWIATYKVYNLLLCKKTNDLIKNGYQNDKQKHRNHVAGVVCELVANWPEGERYAVVLVAVVGI
jgi:hypothetical protein